MIITRPSAVCSFSAFCLLEISGALSTCQESFSAISAASFVAALNPGWNPGNTMDAIPEETSWSNPPLVNSTFANIKRLGFSGIRLPVTWADHMQKEAPYTVDSKWIDRVSDVIDMITSNGLFVLVNAHHDSWISFDLRAADANYTKYEEKFYSLWYQIGKRIACKSSMVAFEPLNEPTGSTAEHAAALDQLHNVFFKAIHDAGGYNSQRVVVLGGLGSNAANLAQWFKTPTANVTNPWALTFHYYSPWDFVAQAWGKTIWGSEDDKTALEADFAAVRSNFPDVPIVVGEFGLEIKPSEAAARWKWFDYVGQMGHKYNFSMILWDASIHFVVDTPQPWQDPTALDILIHAVAGDRNMLADSTEDGNDPDQWTSAYIFHRTPDQIIDQSLPFIWNGNTVLSIQASSSSGIKVLVPDREYIAEGDRITFRAEFLSTLFDQNGSTGWKANITINSSAGADLQLQAIQWDTPQPNLTDFIVNTTNSKNDLVIPFDLKGVPGLATVKARMYNSTYLVDDWTQWLPQSQQGRMTYQTHFDFDAKHVTLRSAVLQKVLEADIATGFTFEFYPRIHANTVNFTIGPVIDPPSMP